MKKYSTQELLEALRGYSREELAEVEGALRGTFRIPPEPVPDPPCGYYIRTPRWDVELVNPGPDKIQSVKALRMSTGIPLKEAKELVRSAPVLLLEYVKPEEAEDLVEALRRAGASVRVTEY